jgi:hypothetical protein
MDYEDGIWHVYRNLVYHDQESPTSWNLRGSRTHSEFCVRKTLSGPAEPLTESCLLRVDFIVPEYPGIRWSLIRACIQDMEAGDIR